MKPSTVLSNLRALMSYEELEAQARASGALKRERLLHPVQMLEGLLATAGNSGGRLADALRYIETVYDVDVNRSSFYKRLDETFAKFVHDVMGRVMETRTVAEHPKLVGQLAGLKDLWAYDSTSVSLRKCLAHTFAVGADSERAGVKLHAGMSLRSHAVIQPRISAQEVSDERGIDLGRALDDVLMLLNRGYSAHKLFSSIGDQGGFYLTRLKTSTNPVVGAVHEGRQAKKSACSMTLDEALEQGILPMDRVVDMGVELSLGTSQPPLPARVVGVPVTDDDGTTKVWWYLTNLPRKGYPPALIRELYRLRWQVELLWKQLKGRFRLDDIEAMTERNVRLVMESAILAHFLSLGVLDATTTAAERKKLTVGRMALAFPFLISRIARILTTDDEEEAVDLARKLRSNVLHVATDTNPKRTRLAAERRRKKLAGAKKTGS